MVLLDILMRMCLENLFDDLYFYCNESSKKIEFPCTVDKLDTKRIKLWFKTKFIPIKWAMKLHLYTEDK